MILAAPPAVTLRVVRVVTVDSNGVKRSWTPDHLAAKHPEAFADLLSAHLKQGA